MFNQSLWNGQRNIEHATDSRRKTNHDLHRETWWMKEFLGLRMLFSFTHLLIHSILMKHASRNMCLTTKQWACNWIMFLYNSVHCALKLDEWKDISVYASYFQIFIHSLNLSPCAFIHSPWIGQRNIEHATDHCRKTAAYNAHWSLMNETIIRFTHTFLIQSFVHLFIPHGTSYPR